MEPFLGFIAAFGFTFAPRTWAFCQGQIISISTNTALFSLLGTTYGGNGSTTFALPDLRGRTLIGQGQGPGLSYYSLGDMGGTENTTLLINNMPAHNHAVVVTSPTPAIIADNSVANTSVPTGNRLAISPKTGSGPNASTLNTYTTATGNPVQLGTAAGPITAQTGISGGSLPFSLVQPFLAINYCISLQGIFPSRN